MNVSSCCERTRHYQLQYGIGSGTNIPLLLQWKFVHTRCTDCGIDKKLQLTECKTLSENTNLIDVLEWINAPRQGGVKWQTKHAVQMAVAVCLSNYQGDI